MRRYRRWSATILISYVSLLSQNASACSCGPVGLESRWDHATHVFSAVVTGRAESEGSTRRMQAVDYSFAVTETFKGDAQFEVLTSVGSSAACGISLAIGEEYLFFTGDFGRIGLCSGVSRIAKDDKPGSARGRSYVRALRAFVSGRTDRVTEPWTFAEDDQFCSTGVQNLKIDENYSYLTISLTFVKQLPENAVMTIDPAHYPGFLSPLIMLFPQPNERPSGIRLEVGTENFVTDAKPEEEFESAYSVPPDHASDLLAALIEHGALTLQWHRNSELARISIPLLDVDHTLVPLQDCAATYMKQ